MPEQRVVTPEKAKEAINDWSWHWVGNLPNGMVVIERDKDE